MSKRILVVEDDFDTRYMLSLILKGEGYEVITAADGEEGLRLALENNNLAFFKNPRRVPV